MRCGDAAMVLLALALLELLIEAEIRSWQCFSRAGAGVL